MQEKVPKYYLLKKNLLDKIEKNEFDSDTPIPSERELMEKYQVSRITVRKAIDELVKEDYLYTIQGKGTYVKTINSDTDMYEINSCTKDVLKLGKTPSKKLIISEIIKADSKRAKLLNITTNDNVFHMGRITYADGEPLNYTLTYLPEKLMIGIQDFDYEKESLYNILEKEYKIKILKSKRSIEAILAKDEIVDYLNVEDDTPLILFGCTTYGIVNGKEVPIETFKCYYRTDKFKFYINQIC